MPRTQKHSRWASLQREVSRIPRNLIKITYRLGSGFGSRYGVLCNLDFFNDGGVRWGRGVVPLTLANANGFAPALTRLMDSLDGTASHPPEVRPASQATGSAECTSTLGTLFAKHGSDKHHHNYHPVYAEVIEKLGRDKPLAVLEIGLGAADPRVPNNMGVRGAPGASVRAWRDALPNAQIYGADIERSILFTETRIKTAFVDQLRPETFVVMCQDLGQDKFDLIVDDGLHSVYANINTLAFALNHLRSGGFVFVEDIVSKRATPWTPVFALLQRHKIPCGFWQCGACYLFWAQKP